MTWQETAKAKREQGISSIPREWILDSIPTPQQVPNSKEYLDRILPQDEVNITNSTILKLAKKLSLGQLSALEVVTAFCHRTALLHQLNNCCSEIFFERAFQRAREQDIYFARTGKTVGPFHGIPISVKDQLNIEGLDSAIGFVSLVNKPKTKDEVSKLVLIMEKGGAIFFVKTITPTAMMSYSTFSNLYGETTNVFNRNVSCGGSSGGEGVVVGGRGALLGFGTDIGGSIRVPSAFQGIFGLRGSSNRIPYCNITNSFAHQPIMPSVVGPMAVDLQDLKFVTKFIIDSKPWLMDPKTPPITWQEQHLPDRLCFAIYESNGHVQPSPPVKRSLDMVVEALEMQGHKVIKWQPPLSSVDLIEIANEIFDADGYKEIYDFSESSGEPILPETLYLGASPGVSHIHEHWESARRKYEAQQAVDSYWFDKTIELTGTGRPVDGVIVPVWDTPSFKTHDVVKFWGDYTCQFNTLDYAVSILPVTVCLENLDVKDPNFKPLTEQDQICYDLYDPHLFHMVPVGVQIVAPRWCEERAIALTEVVSDALSK